MKGLLSSFNASVSGGMILYEVMRQRYGKEGSPSEALVKEGKGQ
jgi:hypothetical protein